MGASLRRSPVGRHLCGGPGLGLAGCVCHPGRWACWPANQVPERTNPGVGVGTYHRQCTCIVNASATAAMIIELAVAKQPTCRAGRQVTLLFLELPCLLACFPSPTPPPPQPRRPARPPCMTCTACSACLQGIPTYRGTVVSTPKPLWGAAASGPVQHEQQQPQQAQRELAAQPPPLRGKGSLCYSRGSLVALALCEMMGGNILACSRWW